MRRFTFNTLGLLLVAASAAGCITVGGKAYPRAAADAARIDWLATRDVSIISEGTMRKTYTVKYLIGTRGSRRSRTSEYTGTSIRAAIDGAMNQAGQDTGALPEEEPMADPMNGSIES